MDREFTLVQIYFDTMPKNTWISHMEAIRVAGSVIKCLIPLELEGN